MCRYEDGERVLRGTDMSQLLDSINMTSELPSLLGVSGFALLHVALAEHGV